MTTEIIWLIGHMLQTIIWDSFWLDRGSHKPASTTNSNNLTNNTEPQIARCRSAQHQIDCTLHVACSLCMCDQRPTVGADNVLIIRLIDTLSLVNTRDTFPVCSLGACIKNWHITQTLIAQCVMIRCCDIDTTQTQQQQTAAIMLTIVGQCKLRKTLVVTENRMITNQCSTLVHHLASYTHTHNPKQQQQQQWMQLLTA